MGNTVSIISSFQNPVIIDVTPRQETLPAPRSSFPPSLRWKAVWSGAIRDDLADALEPMAN